MGIFVYFKISQLGLKYSQELGMRHHHSHLYQMILYLRNHRNPETPNLSSHVLVNHHRLLRYLDTAAILSLRISD